MDFDRVNERLLWLEARGLALAAESRRVRRRARQATLIDEPDIVREIAKLQLETRSREDELRLWRRQIEPRRVVRVVVPPAAPPPLVVPWWRRLLAFMRFRGVTTPADPAKAISESRGD